MMSARITSPCASRSFLIRRVLRFLVVVFCTSLLLWRACAVRASNRLVVPRSVQEDAQGHTLFAEQAVVECNPGMLARS